jgi:hypothetical protein
MCFLWRSWPFEENRSPTQQAFNVGRMTASVTRSGEMIAPVADGIAAPIDA